MLIYKKKILKVSLYVQSLFPRQREKNQLNEVNLPRINVEDLLGKERVRSRSKCPGQDPVVASPQWSVNGAKLSVSCVVAQKHIRDMLT